MEYQRHQLFEYQKRKSSGITDGSLSKEDADMFIWETLNIVPKEDTKFSLNRHEQKQEQDHEEQIAQEDSPDDEY